MLTNAPEMADGGTSRTTARTAGGQLPAAPTQKPRKCRQRTSKRNSAGREAFAYPQTVSVTGGEHPPGRQPGHSVHIAESVRPAVLRSQMGASTYQPNQCLGGVVLPGWQWVCSPRHWSRSTAAAGAGATAALAGVYQAAAVSPSVNRWAAVVEARRPVVRFISVTRWERG